MYESSEPWKEDNQQLQLSTPDSSDGCPFFDGSTLLKIGIGVALAAGLIGLKLLHDHLSARSSGVPGRHPA